MEWVGPVGGVSADWDPGATLQTALGSASTRSATALPQSANTPPTFCVRIRSLEEKVTNLNQDLTGPFRYSDFGLLSAFGDSGFGSASEAHVGMVSGLSRINSAFRSPHSAFH